MTDTPTILIPDRLEPPATIESDVFGDNVTIIVEEATDASDISENVWASATAVLAWHDITFSEDILEKLTNCEIIVRVGVGYDNIDLKAASDMNIPVCNVPDYGTNDVADHTMALALSLWRGLPAYSDRLKESNDGWHWEVDISMRRLTDARFVIIGLGRIGTAVARRAQAFGLDIAAYDPYLPDGYDKSLGIEHCRELSTAIEDADIVTFHTPLTDETIGMADAEFFEMLNDDAVLINTARGELVDLDALHGALMDCTVRAAGLDVLSQEPPNSNHPLITAWRNKEPWIRGRFVLTPHMAFYCDEALKEMRRKAALTAREYLNTGHLRNCVNRAVLPNTNPTAARRY